MHHANQGIASEIFDRTAELCEGSKIVSEPPQPLQPLRVIEPHTSGRASPASTQPAAADVAHFNCS